MGGREGVRAGAIPRTWEMRRNQAGFQQVPRRATPGTRENAVKLLENYRISPFSSIAVHANPPNILSYTSP